jgi:ATP-dependent helicase HepA
LDVIDLKPGQRWISNAEPELGIGRILKVQDRMVTINFDLVDEVRTYAKNNAPLTRVKFNVGDNIRARDQVELIVERVVEREGILIYHGRYQGTDTLILETDLDANVTFSKPEERLFTQQIDDNSWFNLRFETLQQQARLAASPVKGLLAPRVSLIPHQFYIAEEVASRYAPRVLLADEVGLGKTIEAGLIIHRQLTTGLANRILIIVPPSLSFQWFVEMVRRFNLTFTILDEDRCEQIEADNRPEEPTDDSGLSNPFEAQQLMLCSLSLFLDKPKRLSQATDADWDLVVVDEAHHLSWSETPGPDYLAVEALSQVSKGLLLLTATPEQLGRFGHFSRLRLLDPNRYQDFDEFISEEAGYEDVANIIRALEADSQGSIARARKLLGRHAPQSDDDLIPALLDRHGTGRVLFRNVRESVAGFKKRQLQQHELDNATFPLADATGWQSGDPRVSWLIDLLTRSGEKFLVICARAETAIALEKYLREKSHLRSAAFHEYMDLVARDRAASYFADSERGAQVLICSEIGSEGRNFQFAHQMVMFDLPLGPDLVEQRIGRLDRIGQTEDITIHVPFARGSIQEALLRLFDEGFGIFDKPNAAAQTVFDTLRDNLHELPQWDTSRQANTLTNLSSIVSTAKAESGKRLDEMSSGRDKLLELNSHRPVVSAKLIEDVQRHTSASDLEEYMELSFSQFELESEPLNEHVMLVKPTEGTMRNAAVSIETQDRSRYPELPDEGLTYTYDRSTALNREDTLFLTWEHPLVEQAMDLIVSDVTGNNAVVVAKINGVKTGTVLVETLHVIEVVAPPALGASKYLPPSLVRSVITPDLDEVSSSISHSEWPDALPVAKEVIARIITGQEAGIRTMLSSAEVSAQARFEPIKREALETMGRQLSQEMSRLQALSEVNANVRPEELAFLQEQRDALTTAIGAAQIRLDALRVIIAA